MVADHRFVLHEPPPRDRPARIDPARAIVFGLGIIASFTPLRIEHSPYSWAPAGVTMLAGNPW